MPYGMGFKFFNVGKANAEIIRLEAELTAAQSKLAELEKSAASNTSEIEAEAEKLQTDLTAAQAQVTALTSERVSLTSQINTLEAAAATFATEKAAMEKTIETRASTKALEIVAAQGVTAPLATTPNPNPGATPKADRSKLSGRDLMAAAFKEQLTQNPK